MNEQVFQAGRSLRGWELLPYYLGYIAFLLGVIGAVLTVLFSPVGAIAAAVVGGAGLGVMVAMRRWSKRNAHRRTLTLRADGLGLSGFSGAMDGAWKWADLESWERSSVGARLAQAARESHDTDEAMVAAAAGKVADASSEGWIIVLRPRSGRKRQIFGSEFFEHKELIKALEEALGRNVRRGG